MCVMLSHFRERQEVRNTRTALSLQAFVAGGFCNGFSSTLLAATSCGLYQHV
jgi:hypothetical protein